MGNRSGLIFSLLMSAAFLPHANAEEVSDATFRCLNDMTAVRHFYVDNLLGNIEETVAVANNPKGGRYPEGAVVQLVPSEAMVKREPGFNPATNDWEFFELAVSPEGTAIDKRGFAEVVNKFGGNCFACHVQAEPQWDLICGNNHGCAPIPLTRGMITAIQKTDPRCEPVELTDEDKANLKALQAALAAG